MGKVERNNIGIHKGKRGFSGIQRGNYYLINDSKTETKRYEKNQSDKRTHYVCTGLNHKGKNKGIDIRLQATS